MLGRDGPRVTAILWALRAYAGLLIAGATVSEFALGLALGLMLGVAIDQLVLQPLARFLARRGEPR